MAVEKQETVSNYKHGKKSIRETVPTSCVELIVSTFPEDGIFLALLLVAYIVLTFADSTCL